MRRGRPPSVTYFPGHVWRAAEQAIAAMAQPDLILPAQVGPEPPWSPDIELRMALLRGAIEDFVDSFRECADPATARQRAVNRAIAQRWFNGEPGAPLSFEECCYATGSDPSAVRKKIARLRIALEQGRKGLKMSARRGAVREIREMEVVR